MSETVYRLATDDDIQSLLLMGERFFDASGYAGITQYSHESTQKTFEHLISEENGVLIVAVVDGSVVGMIGGMVYPFYFNATHMTSQEFFWWVEPEYRKCSIGIELMRKFEESLERKGAMSLTMISLASMKGDVVGKIYERSGYTPSERTYIKELQHGN